MAATTKKKKKENKLEMPPEENRLGVPDWMLTYGDMTSLLLCFFILLVAVSHFDTEAQVEQLVESINREFGSTANVKALDGSEAGKARIQGAVRRLLEFRDARERARAKSGAKGPPGANSRVDTIRDGDRFTIGGRSLFERGRADLLPEAQAQILLVASYLQAGKGIVEVRAYAPPGEAPAGAKDSDPFDLALRRAEAVANFLRDKGRIAGGQIRVTVASPAESTSLPTASSGAGILERVDISVLEPVGFGSSRSALPTGT